VNNNYSSSTVVKQDFGVVKQVEGRAAHDRHNLAPELAEHPPPYQIMLDPSMVLPVRYYKVLPISNLLHVDVLYYILLGLLFTVEGYDDFSTLTVDTLKDFLSLRGLSTTGRKIELVARAFSAFELKLPVKLSAEELNTKIQKEYLARLQQHDLVDPNGTQSWIDDVTKWPRVDLGKIFCYILAKKEFHSEYIGKYKDQKAYSYWMSNFVGTILFSENNGKYVIKCNVIPSQHVRDEPKKVWVALDMDGTILCGWCTCIAGTSSTCNHMNYFPGIISELWKEFDPRREGQRVAKGIRYNQLHNYFTLQSLEYCPRIQCLFKLQKERTIT
jgi:hypothetical protein